MTAGLTIRTWIGSSTVALAPPKREALEPKRFRGFFFVFNGFGLFLNVLIIVLMFDYIYSCAIENTKIAHDIAHKKPVYSGFIKSSK